MFTSAVAWGEWRRSGRVRRREVFMLDVIASTGPG